MIKICKGLLELRLIPFGCLVFLKKLVRNFKRLFFMGFNFFILICALFSFYLGCGLCLRVNNLCGVYHREPKIANYKESYNMDENLFVHL